MVMYMCVCVCANIMYLYYKYGMNTYVCSITIYTCYTHMYIPGAGKADPGPEHHLQRGGFTLHTHHGHLHFSVPCGPHDLPHGTERTALHTLRTVPVRDGGKGPVADGGNGDVVDMPEGSLQCLFQYKHIQSLRIFQFSP